MLIGLNDDLSLAVDTVALLITQPLFRPGRQAQQIYRHAQFHRGGCFVDVLPAGPGCVNESEFAGSF